MRSIARKISVLLVVAILAMSMVACTSDEIALIEAMSKSSQITSYEGNSKIQLSFKSKGFSEETQKVLDFISSYLDGFTLDMNQKYSSSDDRAIAKIAMDGNLDMQGLSVKYGCWTDMDLTGEEPRIVQIVELPPAIIQPILTFADIGKKKYITIDYGALLNQEDMDITLDFKRIAEGSVELQEMLLDFIKSTAKDFEPGMVVVTKKGYTVTDKGENVTEYELKLSDDSVKKLLHALINDVILQEETIEFAKKYMEATINIYDFPEDAKQEAMDVINGGLDEVAANLATYRDTVTQVFDAIKDIKIFGDNGITTKYYINKDGFLAGGKSSVDIAIKMSDLAALLGKNIDEEDLNGELYLTMDFEDSIYNINKEVSVEIPEVTEENSFDIFNVVLEKYSGIGFIPGIGKEEDSSYEVPVLSDGINVVMNGRVVSFPDVEPQNINGRVLVPIRTISEERGADVSYDAETKQVLIVKGDTEILLTLGSQEAYVNGELIMLDTPAMVIEGRTMVPVRFVSENMDATVEWDGNAQIVYIFY